MNVLEEIRSWLKKKESPVAFLVGGNETTDFAINLVRELGNLHCRNMETQPNPTYLDMKVLWPQTDHPSLRVLIERILEHSLWLATEEFTNCVTASRVLHDAKKGGLVVFDNIESATKELPPPDLSLLLGQLVRLGVIELLGGGKPNKVLISIKKKLLPSSVLDHTLPDRVQKLFKIPCELCGLDVRQVPVFELQSQAKAA